MNAMNTRPTSESNVAHQEAAGDIVILCAEEEIRDAIAYWLTALPERTVVAGDGYQAAKVLENGCRWLITDRVLPPWPGLDTFLTLRARHPLLQIAFVENDNLHDGILAKITGASVLLQRPLTRQAVLGAMARTKPQA